MSSFEDQLKAFAAKVKAREQAVFVGTVAAVKDSIVNGSATTGSPGQPVRSGELKNSFHVEFESPDVAIISTNLDYAPIIEHNLRGARVPAGVGPDADPKGSRVGGSHSVKQTVAGFQRLVDAEVRKVNP